MLGGGGIHKVFHGHICLAHMKLKTLPQVLEDKGLQDDQLDAEVQRQVAAAEAVKSSDEDVASVLLIAAQVACLAYMIIAKLGDDVGNIAAWGGGGGGGGGSTPSDIGYSHLSSSSADLPDEVGRLVMRQALHYPQAEIVRLREAAGAAAAAQASLQQLNEVTARRFSPAVTLISYWP